MQEKGLSGSWEVFYSQLISSSRCEPRVKSSPHAVWEAKREAQRFQYVHQRNISKYIISQTRVHFLRFYHSPLKHLSNYSYQRSGEVTSDTPFSVYLSFSVSVSVQFLDPKGLRSSLCPTLLLPVSICPQPSKTSMVHFGHLVPSSDI